MLIWVFYLYREYIQNIVFPLNYVYLGLNIPIIGLMGGSAKKIINENNFGIASNNFTELNNKLKSLSINDLYNMRKSIKKIKQVGNEE